MRRFAGLWATTACLALLPTANGAGPPPRVLPAGARVAAPDLSAAPAVPVPADGELTADALVAQVLTRNPTLAQMQAAAAAAAARYPQAISLEDPMLGATGSPRMFNHTDDGGYRFELSQKYPWPGKLRLRGENAAAEARAAGQDVVDTRLQLIQAARDAFADYYLAGRGLAVNKENLDLLESVESNQRTRYETARIPQQELLRTQVEIGRQRERLLTLERMLEVARARINTLLNLSPDAPLPPPPEQLPPGGPLPDEAALRAAALAQRPDLRALSEHIAAERASLALAYKEYYPDFEVMGAYDDFWGERPLRPQLAVRMNLPIRLAKRDAAVQEAQAKLGQRIAELNRRIDDVNLAVAQSYAEVGESDKTVDLYKKSLLPPAELDVNTLKSEYTTGKASFIDLLDAERSLIELRDRYYDILADAYRRRAALERSVGGPVAPNAP